jgi:hypothetical protein
MRLEFAPKMQVCQMIYFKIKNSNLGKFWEGLSIEDVGMHILWPFSLSNGHLVYFVAIWYILWPFGIFCGHLVYFVAIWYILWSFGIFPPFRYAKPRKIWQPWQGVAVARAEVLHRVTERIEGGAATYACLFFGMVTIYFPRLRIPAEGGGWGN